MTDGQLDTHDNKLAEVCVKLGLRFPIAELSKNLGYAKSVVSSYHKNKKRMSSKFIERLENFYNIDYKTFLEEHAKQQETLEDRILALVNEALDPRFEDIEQKQAVLRTDFDRIVEDERFEIRKRLNKSGQSKQLGGE